MRGWYRPTDGRWIDVGSDRRYDHAACASDHDDDFQGILREVDGTVALLPGCVAPEGEDQVVGIDEMADVLCLDELDPNDAAVAMGWVRVNCASSVTTGPYLHARSEEDLRAGVAYARLRGIDLSRPGREGFGGPFSGIVCAFDVATGSQRHAEYAFDRSRRLTMTREVTFAREPAPQP